jgi:hypothetical protein
MADLASVLASLADFSNINDPSVISDAIRMAREGGASEEEIRTMLAKMRGQQSPMPAPRAQSPIIAPPLRRMPVPEQPMPDLPGSVFGPAPPMPDLPGSVFGPAPAPPPIAQPPIAPQNLPIPQGLGAMLPPTLPEMPQLGGGIPIPRAPDRGPEVPSLADQGMGLLEALQGALGYLGSSLDKLGGREFRGLLGGHPEELLSAVPFSDELGWTNPRNIVSGRDLTNRWGVTDPSDRGLGATLAGMGAEFVLDPLTIAGGAGLARRGLSWLGNTAREANAVREFATPAARAGGYVMPSVEPAMEAATGLGSKARFPVSEHLPNIGPSQFRDIFGKDPMGRLAREEAEGFAMRSSPPMGIDRPAGGFPLATNIPGIDPAFARELSADLGEQMAREHGLMGIPQVTRGPRPWQGGLRNPYLSGMETGAIEDIDEVMRGLRHPLDIPRPGLSALEPPMVRQPVSGPFIGRSGRTYPMPEPFSDTLLDRLMNTRVPLPLGMGLYEAGRMDRGY